MKDKRFWFGVVVSIAWVGLAAYVLRTTDHPEKLNEWGDFIAGFSAPLAFFWLVLGYMQQGEELKQSTAALKLQAKELKNSVEQQTQLVAVTREQMQKEIAALEAERKGRTEAARPRFVPNSHPFMWMEPVMSLDLRSLLSTWVKQRRKFGQILKCMA